MNKLLEMLQAELELVGAFGPFFADLIEKEAELAEQALHDMDNQFDQPTLEKRYLGFLEEDAPGELAAGPRRLRSQEMIRIIFRDLTRRADLLETTAELSHLADFYKRKMRAHLTPGSRWGAGQGARVAAGIDLKQDAGAIVDIEFMVQYAVLG